MASLALNMALTIAAIRLISAPAADSAAAPRQSFKQAQGFWAIIGFFLASTYENIPVMHYST
jgi:hypothetical protein